VESLDLDKFAKGEFNPSGMVCAYGCNCGITRINNAYMTICGPICWSCVDDMDGLKPAYCYEPGRRKRIFGNPPGNEDR
jgi:hypothetical protein